MSLLALLAALTTTPADTIRVVLVATADVHGHVTDWDYVQNVPAPGGLARAATVIDSLRERYPGQVVLVDAGDALQGTPFAAYFSREAPRDPHPVIDAMNTLGYDAATPGNHEFDFGVPLFERALAAAAFPVVSANLRRLPADSLAFPPFVVIQRNGLRIAIAGFLTPGTMVWHRDRLRDRYRVDRIGAAAPAILREMRRESDLMIVLAHSGLDGPSSYDTTGIGAEHVALGLARGAVRPDVVVVGHSHGELRDSVAGGVHFIQPRPRAQGLAVLHLGLESGGAGFRIVEARGESISLQSVRPSARFLRRLADPHAAALTWAASVIGEARGSFRAGLARVEDTPFMQFLHHVQRRATGADLSMAPVFEPRTGFGEGEITVGELYQAYPYENTLRAVRLSGAALRAWLEQSARYFTRDSLGRVVPDRRIPGYSYDILGGARYTIDLARPVGSRVTRLEVKGRPVAPGDSFTVAVSDHRQQGGGNFPMVARAAVVYDKGENIRDLLLAEIRRRRVLVRPDSFLPEWTLAPAALAAEARAHFAEAPPPRVAEPAQPTIILPPRPVAEPDRDLPAPSRRPVPGEVAAAPVATLRLPAEAGIGRSLARTVADAYRNAMRADVAVVGEADVAARIAAGPVTPADAAQAAPVEGTLLSIRMNGADLLDMVENLVTGGTACCELSGVRVEYNPRGRDYDRVKRVRLTTGADVERKRTYLVALSPALLEGDSLFLLGASDCRPGRGCRTAGRLSRWPVVRSDRIPGAALADYLSVLPQPVTPPDDLRLLPNR